MNEQWLTESYNVAMEIRESNRHYLEKYEYLDIMGLFETDWMTLDHVKEGGDYGYPKKT